MFWTWRFLLCHQILKKSRLLHKDEWQSNTKKEKDKIACRCYTHFFAPHLHFSPVFERIKMTKFIYALSLAWLLVFGVGQFFRKLFLQKITYQHTRNSRHLACTRRGINRRPSWWSTRHRHYSGTLASRPEIENLVIHLVMPHIVSQDTEPIVIWSRRRSVAEIHWHWASRIN